jgi:hypothetical protein
MADTTLNLPIAVDEVRELFERYELALSENDIATLDMMFWDSPHTVRYAPNQRGYGFDAIHAHRLASTPAAKGERIRLEITSIGEDVATVNLEYRLRRGEGTGVQSQTWFRFPNLGWKIISAHVSTSLT